MDSGIRIDYQPATIDSVDTDGRGIATFSAIAIRQGPLPYKKVNRPPMPEHGLGALPDVSEDEIQWEHIPAEEMLDSQALESLQHAPVTDGHPPDFVDAGTVEIDAAGITGGEINVDHVEVEDLGEVKALRVRVSVFDQGLVHDIKNGTKQISTGRTVDLVPESGEFRGQPYDLIQKSHKFNHMAILDRGRCGPACSVEDGAEDLGSTSVLIGASIDTDDSEQDEDPESVLVDSMEDAEDVESLDQAFTDLVERRISDLEQDRDQTLESIAQQANREVREVEAQIAGSVQPVPAVLRAISQVVSIPLSLLKERVPGSQEAQDALARGLGLIEDEPSKSNSTSNEEVSDMSIEVQVGDSEMAIDTDALMEELDCEDCGEVFDKLEDQLQTVVDAQSTKIERLQGRLEQATADTDETDEDTEDEGEEDDEDTEDQPEPGAPADPEAGQAGMSQEEVNKLINLVSLIREEQPDYDPDGKELMQVMLDALEILGGVDLENAFGSNEAEDADISRARLEGRVDQVMDAYMAKKNIEDVGEVTPNGEKKDTEDTEDADERLAKAQDRLENFHEEAGS